MRKKTKSCLTATSEERFWLTMLAESIEKAGCTRTLNDSIDACEYIATLIGFSYMS